MSSLSSDERSTKNLYDDVNVSIGLSLSDSTSWRDAMKPKTKLLMFHDKMLMARFRGSDAGAILVFKLTRPSRPIRCDVWIVKRMR